MSAQPGRAGTPTVRARGPLPGLAGLLLFAAVAVAALWPGLFSGHDTIVGNTGDPSIFIWSLEWTPFAIGHHLNPLVTDYLHYPSGANLMWNTSIVFPALVLWPVTLLFGPLVSYNVLAVAGMTLSGWCAHLAVGRWTRRWVAAAVAGLLYEMSPYMLSQITGHANLFVAIFPPLLVILGDEILVRQRGPAWRWGALLGLASACQLMTSSEVLATSAIMGALAVALAIFAALAAFPLSIQFAGPQTLHGALEGFGLTARPTSFVIPSYLQLIGGPSAVLDSSVYVGLPLLVLALVVAVRLRRRPEVVVAAGVVAGAMVLALGGHLAVHGAPTRIPLPWDIAQHVPVLRSAIPTRLMLYGYLGLGLLLAVFVDAALAGSTRRRWAGLAVTAIALIPLIPTLPVGAGRYAIPAFFTDGSAARIGATGSVLMTPYGSTPYLDFGPEVWQAASGMAFRTQLGLVFTPGPGGHTYGPPMDALGTELHALDELGARAPATLSGPERRAYAADLSAHAVTAVVAGPSPGEGQVARFLTELLGRPGRVTGGVEVWSGIHP